MVTTGRNWYQVYLLVLTMVFVGSAWLSGGEGQVIAATFPAWSQYLWYGGLLIGAAAALVGIGLGTVVGLLIERAALFWLAGLCGAYGMAFLAFSSRSDVFHAVYVVTFVALFALANLTRARAIRRDIDRLRWTLRRLGDTETAS